MIDDDLDAPEDFEKEPVAEKPSLKEIWDNNPALKIVAIVLGGAVLLGLYFIIFGGNDNAVRSKVRLGDVATAKQVPGKQEVDSLYRAALEATNKKTAEIAAKTGTSALPVPIAVSKSGGLNIPEMPVNAQTDVLAEWKKAADLGRMRAAKDAVEEENAATPVPEAVPMVQPIRPQQQLKQDPGEAKALAAQMRIIIASQGPVAMQTANVTQEASPYEVQKAAQAAQAKLAAASGGVPDAWQPSSALGSAAAANGVAEAPKVIVSAGSIAYAQLLNSLDSDIPGPVLAQVLSGPFAGGRLIGKLSVLEVCECMVMTFSTIVKDNVSYKVDAIALDENTQLAAITPSDVDHHYVDTIVLPAAAAFLTGYTTAESTVATTTTATEGVGTQASSPAPTTKQSIFKGLDSASQTVTGYMQAAASRPVTVTINQGITMGIFFTNTVTTKDAQ